jgi:hypothetical protein
MNKFQTFEIPAELASGYSSCPDTFCGLHGMRNRNRDAFALSFCATVKPAFPFLVYNPNQFRSRKLLVSHVRFHWISIKSPSDDAQERRYRNPTQDACEHLG